MPRSGTSLVEQIISSHNEVLGGGELIHMSQIINEKILNNSNKILSLEIFLINFVNLGHFLHLTIVLLRFLNLILINEIHKIFINNIYNY